MFLFHKNLFWKLNQFFVLLLWVYLLYNSLNRLDFTENTLFHIFLISHIGQGSLLSFSDLGGVYFSKGQRAILILLFGYSWWLPLYLKRKFSRSSL